LPLMPSVCQLSYVDIVSKYLQLAEKAIFTIYCLYLYNLLIMHLLNKNQCSISAVY
jgi:hypothetical protein